MIQPVWNRYGDARIEENIVSLLSIKDLSVAFSSRNDINVIIKDVSLNLEAGEILGLVGESGAGKSTVGNAIINLLPKNAYISSGKILLNNNPISDIDECQIQTIRGSEIGFIFQDPMTSLNPLLTIKTQLIETIIENLKLDKNSAFQKAIQMLEAVGIPAPSVRINQYPHQFSGGMRQRVVIAIALSCKPKLIIADEPTTALDVSIQNQILELIKQLCKQQNVGCIFVSHDIGVISNICDRVAVMYKGQVVEIGNTDSVLFEPKHPLYSKLNKRCPKGRYEVASLSICKLHRK